MKLRSALLLVVAATVCALGGLLTPQVASASVDAVTQWPAMPPIVSDSTNGNLSGKFTVGAGNNRVLLVAVATEYTAGNPTIAATYGGTALTNIAAATNATGLNKIWVGYLVLGNATAPSAATLAVTNTTPTGLTATYVTAAVYKGVDQAAPISGSGSVSGSTATLTTSNFAVNGITGNNGLAVFISNFAGATLNTTGTATKVREYPGANFNLAAGQESVVTNAADNQTVTASAAVSGVLAGIGLNPVPRTGTNYSTVNTCGDCHGYPPQDGSARNVPGGQFTGSHDKHAGANANQYSFTCTQCHYDNTGKLNHSTGYRNITGSSLPGNAYSGTKKVLSTNNGGTGTCTNVTCHSSGRATRQYATSPAWGATTTCLSCHGGRNSSTSAYTRSASNFSMSTTHSQHLKYQTTEINCQMCHGKTAANHTALKNYTGSLYHANGSKNINFTNIAYGSMTSYKSPLSGSAGTTKTCNNTACHGGKSRGSWQDTAATNSDHTCAHCHGIAGTTPAAGNADRRLFAPGYKRAGTSTDQNVRSDDLRVGAHFKHLSSAYMTNIKCNECHLVPSKPFDSATNHTLNNTRFNLGTISFNQASSATIVIGVAPGSTPARNNAVTFVSGTASAAAICNTAYCHGNRLKGGDTTGSYRSPYWNYSAMINYTDKVNSCGRCHGNPPRHGAYSSTHVGQTPTTSCSGCHSATVDALGNIKDKTKHINGILEATGGHEYSFGGSKHRPGGTGSITVTSITDFSKCTGCHSQTSGGTYPVSQRKLASALVCTVCHKNNPNFYTTGSKGTCGDCHGSNTAGYYSTGQPDGNAFPNISGSHSAHIAQGYGCANCHNNRGTTVKTHGNYSGIAKTTYMNISVAFNATAGPAAKWNNGAGTLANTSCTTSVCHGSKSPAWGAPVPNQQCVRCHGSQSVAYSTFSSAQVAPGVGNIDTNRVVGNASPRGGMHQEHLNASNGISDKMHCGSCHASTVGKAVNHAQLDNRTTATVAFNGLATAASHNPIASRSGGIYTCNNTYCHTANRPAGAGANQGGLNNMPLWNDGTFIGGTTVLDTCANKCHGLPPGAGVTGDTHQALTAVTAFAGLPACSSYGTGTGCHPTISNVTPTSIATIWSTPANKLLHINGTVDGGTCVGCHSKNITRTKGRPGVVIGNVVAEFGLAYGHKKTGRSTVTDEDCIVCHLEGDGTTHKPSSYHKDGNIDLRDPWGAGETPITNMSGGAFTFQRFSTSYAAGSRLTTLNNNDIAQVITLNFCIRCHSASGATNPTARSNNGGTATANLPFGVSGNTYGANYTVLNGASVAGGVVNVFSQFSTGNSSVHPVRAARNADFPIATRLNAPYNNQGTPARVAAGGTKSLSVILNCFDCHNTYSATANGPMLTRRTVAAHGTNNTKMVRGTFYVASPSLCVSCHYQYDVTNTANHGSGSALNSTLEGSGGEGFSTCNNCHSSTTAVPARPIPAFDYHGFNKLLAGGNWTGTNANKRPYAFIRNITNFVGHRPKVANTDWTTGSATCVGGASQCAANNGTRTYTPGGQY